MSAKNCQKCGSALDTGSVGLMCPGCLLREALESGPGDDGTDADIFPRPFGSYELRIAPDGQRRGAADTPIRGELRDLGGPLAVSGALTIRNGRDYVLSGQVAPRPAASADLVKLVEYLGAPDAQGRRAFTLEGSF